jgi:TonB family protein
MSQRLLHLMPKFAAVSLCLFAIVGRVPAQSATGATAPETGVVLTKLFPPVYPPLARQARIMGDVKIQVGIRQDGSLASADVISGHPMLKQAALESAKHSTFVCRGCSEAGSSDSLTYTFELSSDCRFGPNCQPLDPRAPEVTQSERKITINSEPTCTCDPAVTRVKVRAAKCLYLWKCGFREAAND